MPFLLNEDLVARVDLKSLRTDRVLLVNGFFPEKNTDHELVASELVKELGALADFLNLSEIKVAGNSKSANLLRSFVD